MASGGHGKLLAHGDDGFLLFLSLTLHQGDPTFFDTEQDPIIWAHLQAKAAQVGDHGSGGCLDPEVTVGVQMHP